MVRMGASQGAQTARIAARGGGAVCLARSRLLQRHLAVEERVLGILPARKAAAPPIVCRSPPGLAQIGEMRALAGPGELGAC